MRNLLLSISIVALLTSCRADAGICLLSCEKPSMPNPVARKEASDMLSDSQQQKPCCVVSELSDASKQEAELIKNLPILANMTIPTVQAAQIINFAKYTELWEKDKSNFNFRCERWGDYLVVFLERNGKKETLSIQLGQAITLKEGHDPDLKGSNYFYWEMVRRQGQINYTPVLRFPGVDLDLYKEEDKIYIDYGESHTLNVKVDSTARPAVDDTIEFGSQSQSIGNSYPHIQNTQPNGLPSIIFQSGLSYISNSFTLQIPYSLGGGVYLKILTAIKDGYTPPEIKNN